MPKAMSANTQEEGKHRFYNHKEQKNGIRSTEERNNTEMQDNIKSNYEKVKDYEQKTNYSNDCLACGCFPRHGRPWIK